MGIALWLRATKATRSRNRSTRQLSPRTELADDELNIVAGGTIEGESQNQLHTNEINVVAGAKR